MYSAQVTECSRINADPSAGTHLSVTPDRALVRLHPGDEHEPRSQHSRGQHGAYRIIEFAGRVFAVPQVTGPVCLADDQQRASPWILSAGNVAELREQIDRQAAQGPVLQCIEEFVGYDVFVHGSLYCAIESTHVADLFQNGAPSATGAVVERSLPELRRRLLEITGIDIPGEVLGTCDDYVLAQTSAGVLAFPLNMRGLEHLSEADQEATGVVRRKSRLEVEDAICNQAARRRVEFAGWLPVFKRFGNCGTHPQFGHTTVPPAGYSFVQSPLPPASGMGVQRLKRLAGSAIRHVKVGWAMARLSARCLATGAAVPETIRFLRTRHFKSQVQLPRRSQLLFLTSVPFTYGQDPWVIEIEDLASLLFPCVDNGRTANVNIEKQPGFLAVKALLEDHNCRGIITHIRATADGISKLFQSETITRKTTHIPMGVRCPALWQRQEPSPTINLLFTNSWHQAPGSFYLRGGLDVLEAFSTLHNAYPELRLTLRTAIPHDLPAYYRNIIADCGVTVLDKFLSAAELERLMVSSHLLLLPSARIHIMSVLQAMAYGLVPVVSDGWGMTEYVEHGRNGLVVGGRYGKVAWNDEQNGMLREYYSPMYHGDSQVTQNLVNELSLLADDANLRRELGQNARREVQVNFSLARWNVGLKKALDQAWTGS